MTSLFDISIPPITNVLTTTAAILKQAETWAQEKNMAMSDLLSARLYEDMLPLAAQVFIVNGAARKVIERLTGTTTPALEKAEGRALGEESLEELHTMTASTLKQLSAVTRESIEGKENTEVPCKFFTTEYKAKAAEYVHGYSIPTVYFHLDMVYAILRSKGVPLGKKDYMFEFMKGFEVIGESA